MVERIKRHIQPSTHTHTQQSALFLACTGLGSVRGRLERQSVIYQIKRLLISLSGGFGFRIRLHRRTHANRTLLCQFKTERVNPTCRLVDVVRNEAFAGPYNRVLDGEKQGVLGAIWSTRSDEVAYGLYHVARTLQCCRNGTVGNLRKGSIYEPLTGL
uniref:Uncharacterized protein n=1 Tax=Anopheles atroparvus TaxID=41427 RepID=A0AAG5DWC8_ANOAO